MLAYHFISRDFVTRFSKEQTGVGQTLSCEGDLEICRNGLHASIHPLDAAKYAETPQMMLCLVELTGVVEWGDKVCGRTRKILKAFDATKMLQEFSIWCAEDVLSIFERQYPNDNRPRLAIEAARIATESPTEGNKAAAAAAADAAARAAAYAAAYAYAYADAADAAAAAADAAAYAADAAAYADAAAVRAAAYAARAAKTQKYRDELLRRVEEKFSQIG